LSVGVRYNFADDKDVVRLNDFSWGTSLSFVF